MLGPSALLNFLHEYRDAARPDLRIQHTRASILLSGWNPTGLSGVDLTDSQEDDGTVQHFGLHTLSDDSPKLVLWADNGEGAYGDTWYSPEPSDASMKNISMVFYETLHITFSIYATSWFIEEIGYNNRTAGRGGRAICLTYIKKKRWNWICRHPGRPRLLLWLGVMRTRTFYISLY